MSIEARGEGGGGRSGRNGVGSGLSGAVMKCCHSFCAGDSAGGEQCHSTLGIFTRRRPPLLKSCVATPFTCVHGEGDAGGRAWGEGWLRKRGVGVGGASERLPVKWHHL